MDSRTLSTGDPVPYDEYQFRVYLESWKVVPLLTRYSLQANTSSESSTGRSSALGGGVCERISGAHGHVPTAAPTPRSVEKTL